MPSRYSIIEFLKSMALSSPTYPIPKIAYFYCSRDAAEPERADPDCLVRSLLSQICSSKAGINELVLTEFRERRENAKMAESDLVKLTIEETVGYIIKLSQSEPAVFIVIDAIDECDPTSRYKLLSALETINRSPSCSKVAVSSRDDDDLVRWQKGHPVRLISANENQKDIKRFIDLKVSLAIAERRLLYGEVSDSLKMSIISKLYEKAERM
jgi:hypothetical protein